jgi:hypothetical protein
LRPSFAKIDMEFTAKIGVSQKGTDTLLYRGFDFWKKNILPSGDIVWRCSKFMKFKCHATVVTRGEVVVRNREPEHNHGGNVAKVLARNAVADMKRRVAESDTKPSSAIASTSTTLPESVMMALPKKSQLARTLRRHRQKTQDTGGVALPQPPTDKNFGIPSHFQNFVLSDSGPGEERIIIFGQSQLVDGLSKASFWLADGTFKIVPSVFFQVYTLHFQYVEGINPAALYCLLPNKTKHTYDRLITEIKRLVPAGNPAHILLDFETAAMSAFRQHYPEATVRGCYYHLTQSVLRKVQEVGLKIQYEQDDEIRCYLRCLSAISHVPISDVIETFEILVDVMPQNEYVDEVVTYFEHTYIRGRRLRGRGDNYAVPIFGHDIWNQRDSAAEGIARTNNVCEGWHNGVHSLITCSHPSMWRFIEGLKRDSVLQLSSFLQGATGVRNLSEKRYRDLRERVQRVMASYQQTDRLTFLRAIAYLSYS